MVRVSKVQQIADHQAERERDKKASSDASYAALTRRRPRTPRKS